ncbi:MAG TPA: VWA domain-containing protein [Blastocatellia bacterium]|nr:VWA domain-containing protein [Blastocatellia bacterium]
MKKRRISSLLIALSIIVPAAVLDASGSASAPDASPQKVNKSNQGEIKLSAELVQIDVLVTDKQGKPAGGLKREDFELFDNNKPQHITDFSYEVADKRRAGDQTTGARSLPRAIGAGELKRVIAFVVDTLHIKYVNMQRTRKMLEDFVDNKMQPGDLVLILPTSGGSGLLQQFTSDQRLLHRSIDRLRPFYFSNDTTPYRSTSHIFTGSAGPPMGIGNRRGTALPSVPELNSGDGAKPDPLEEADVRATLTALNETLKSMGKLPGRKVGVLVSEGLRLLATRTWSDLDNTTALAARSNVVFYTIDPRGLDPLVPGAGDELDRDSDIMTALASASDRRRDDFHQSQDSLKAIAADTGGKFFGNNNDINQGLVAMLDENSAYYLLGFYPEAGRWDGRFHRIKVAVRNRPDLSVSFRKGYLAKSPPPHPNSKLEPRVAEAIEAISSPLVRRDIDLRLTPLFTDDPKHEPLVTLLLHIDASRLSFTQTDGRFENKLDEIGFIVDANGKAVDQFANTLELNLQPASYDGVLKRGLVATRTLNVKPGVYQVRLFVREPASGLIGTANDYIDIPDIKADRLSTSSLFLSGQAIEDGKVVNIAGEGGTPSQRRFKRDGEFIYSLVIYNPKVDGKTKAPDLEMQTRVLKGRLVVFSGQPRAVMASNGSTPTRVITGGIVKLVKLSPDDYTLEVIIRDKLRGNESRGIVRQEMDFSVE